MLIWSGCNNKQKHIKFLLGLMTPLKKSAIPDYFLKVHLFQTIYTMIILIIEKPTLMTELAESTGLAVKDIDSEGLSNSHKIRNKKISPRPNCTMYINCMFCQFLKVILALLIDK